MGDIVNFPELIKYEDSPAYILARIERILVALALANLTVDGLAYMVTKLQWDLLVDYLQSLMLGPSKPSKDVVFIVYKGMPIRQRK